MSVTLITVCAVQGVAFIGALIHFSFRAGRVLERVEANSVRITRLEGSVYGANACSNTNSTP